MAESDEDWRDWDATGGEFDAAGRRCAITIEHARGRAALPRFTFEHVA